MWTEYRHTSMHMAMQIDTPTRTPTPIYVLRHIPTHTPAAIQTHTPIYTWLLRCKDISTHTHIYLHIHHICTYTHTYTHAYMVHLQLYM